MMSVARYIAKSLDAYGVDHVFFMDAILKKALGEMEDFGIRRILAHSEKAAAYMADGYARVSGRPGVCMAQSVGAANLAAGLQDPFLANSAIIALTGRQVADNQYRNAYQEIPHGPLFASVSKCSYRAEAPEQFARLFRQAFRDATSAPGGPVHIDVAGHTGGVLEQMEGPIDTVEETRYARFPSERLLPGEGAVLQVAEAIRNSLRPVLVAGMGAVISGAQDALRQLAEKQSIPVVGSLDAKALLPTGHRLNAGIVGTYSDECANRLLAEADLAIFVGSDTGDQVTNNWTLPLPGTRIVQIDCDPRELGRNFPGAIGLAGDPRDITALLAARLPSDARADWVARCDALKGQWAGQMDVLRHSDALPMRPERLCHELGLWLSHDAIVVADTGYASHWTGIALDMPHASQRYIRAAGSLGWAFPAALGAKCAAPERPVVCFTGDGGFMYHLAELETARRWGLNTITVVNNNHRLGQGLRNLNIAYGARVGRKDDLIVYRDTDFAQVARAFDCAGRRVETPAELGEALRWAETQDVPVVIDVVSEPEALTPVAWTPEAPLKA